MFQLSGFYCRVSFKWILKGILTGIDKGLRVFGFRALSGGDSAVPFFRTLALVPLGPLGPLGLWGSWFDFWRFGALGLGV